MLHAENTPWVASDSLLCPYAHLSDGFLDLIYVRKTNKVGRTKLASFLLSLGSGKHVDMRFVESLIERIIDVSLRGTA